MSLVGEVRHFLKRTGMPPATFGRRAMKDPAWVQRLLDGSEPQAKTIEKVRAFMAKEGR